jgi:hypothetical protein
MNKKSLTLYSRIKWPIILVCCVALTVFVTLFVNDCFLSEDYSVRVKYRINGKVNINSCYFEKLYTFNEVEDFDLVKAVSQLGAGLDGYDDSDYEIVFKGAWYDKSKQYMVVLLGDTYYHYCDFPEYTWKTLKEMEGPYSKYSFYENSIRGHYSCEGIEVPIY